MCIRDRQGGLRSSEQSSCVCMLKNNCVKVLKFSLSNLSKECFVLLPSVFIQVRGLVRELSGGQRAQALLQGQLKRGQLVNEAAFPPCFQCGRQQLKRTKDNREEKKSKSQFVNHNHPKYPQYSTSKTKHPDAIHHNAVLFYWCIA
eukprot:6193046-Amphidinium_carterae.1